MVLDPFSIFLGKVADIIINIGKERFARSEDAVSFLQRYGYGNLKDNFETLYVHTLVRRRQGGAPEAALGLFRHPDVAKAFRDSWRAGFRDKFDRGVFGALERLAVGDKAKNAGVDVLAEGKAFWDTFARLVSQARSPGDQRTDVKIDEMHDVIVKKVTPEKEAAILHDYLEAVVADTRRIDIKGIFSKPGAGRKAINFAIEEIYTPLKTQPAQLSLADMEELSDADVIKGGDRILLTQLLSRHRRLLIVGAPGGGKTTFLRLIACVLAKDGLERSEPGRQRHLGLPLDEPAPVPILIRLAALAGVIRDDCAGVGCGGSWTIIVRAMDKLYGPETSAVLKNLLDNGLCALLLDGLDEVAEQKMRDRIVDVVNAALQRWGKNMVVLSSRPHGYHDIAALEKIVTARIDIFGESEITRFIEQWGQALFGREGSGESSTYLSELKTAIIDSKPIRRLASNPIMLTCLCVVHWNERRLPEGKADLLAAVLRWLLNAREEHRKQKGITNVFAEECFKSLALAMTDDLKGKQTIVDLAWAAGQLEIPFRDIQGIEGEDRIRREGIGFLEDEMLHSGIVEKYGTGQLRFWHLNFQEHYAARALVDRSDRDWWNRISPHLGDTQWTEVLDHLAGCLAWTGRFRLDLLVKNVLSTAKTDDLASVARAVGVLGRLLRILAVYHYDPPAHLGYEKAKKSIMAIFALAGAAKVPVEQRIAAAEALGHPEDPRFVTLEPAMLPVPGEDRMYLGKYPVTVAEYRRFIENKGYVKPKYWQGGWATKEEKKWEQPARWDEQFEHPNRPVTGVSWYEAMAYCAWLSEQTGKKFNLPEEEIWEKAATHPQGDYPWGRETPNRELLNYDNNVGNPTPVGVYPLGAAPGGHLDMAGNVWEWTNTTESRGVFRVVRGGCWGNPAHGCRSAIRGSFESVIRSYDVGFRLSRSVALGP